MGTVSTDEETSVYYANKIYEKIQMKQKVFFEYLIHFHVFTQKFDWLLNVFLLSLNTETGIFSAII